MNSQWDYVCMLSNGVAFDEMHRTLHNIDDKDKATILAWVDEHKANVQALLDTPDPHTLKAQPNEPTFNMSFHVTFSDGSPGASLALVGVPYKVMHACEQSIVDVSQSMVKEGRKYGKSKGWAMHDEKNVKKLKHIDVK
jgi:hypothetical protein